jgi:hypothetical protein
MQHYASLRLDYLAHEEALPYTQIENYAAHRADTDTAEETWTRLSAQRHGIRWDYRDYHYEGKRLTHIELYIVSSLTASWIAEERLDYDKQGRLERITRIIPQPNKPHRLVVYRKRQPGETFASLIENAKAKLIHAIPKAVAEAKFDERLYCLNLVHSFNLHGDIFPPHLQLYAGKERDRQRKIREFEPYLVPGNVWWYPWEFDDDDANLNPSVPITDPETLDACERLNIEFSARLKSDLATKILYQIAHELNQLDWSQYAPVTPDFIVYACDDTKHTDIDEVLRLSGATKEQLADWRKRGLL